MAYCIVVNFFHRFHRMRHFPGDRLAFLPEGVAVGIPDRSVGRGAASGKYEDRYDGGQEDRVTAGNGHPVRSRHGYAHHCRMMPEHEKITAIQEMMEEKIPYPVRNLSPDERSR
jgi:hypothetical protein